MVLVQNSNWVSWHNLGLKSLVSCNGQESCEFILRVSSTRINEFCFHEFLCFFAKQMPTRRRRHWLRVSEIEGVFNGIELFFCKLCVLWCVDLPDLGWSHRSHQKFRRAKGLWPMGCPTVGSQYVRDWSKFKDLRSFPTPHHRHRQKMTSKKKTHNS